MIKFWDFCHHSEARSTLDLAFIFDVPFIWQDQYWKK